MKNGPFDDKWQIEVVNPNPFHQNINATSSNPNDPILTIDHWANSLNHRLKYDRSKSIFICFHPSFNFKCT